MNIVFLFRAQNKNEYKKGESPKAIGMMPVSSRELWYEMDIMFLLEEGADGFPSFTPAEKVASQRVGSRTSVKTGSGSGKIGP